MTVRVAVAGAGIYGSSIAIRLAEHGCDVTLFDPLGLMQAASAINQYRVHRGYHYPRSPETIREVLDCRDAFIDTYREAILDRTAHYYAMPWNGSRLDPDAFEAVMAAFSLPFARVAPHWIDPGFIARCWQVEEEIYDPERLREVIRRRLAETRVSFVAARFDRRAAEGYDHVIYATYGGSGSHAHLFPAVRFQVAEKILIELPEALRRLAVVVVDGPFTAFDPYGGGACSLFGSARHTNHWETAEPDFVVPEPYRAILNEPTFRPVPFTRFEAMRADAALAIPQAAAARYLGSRFTLRVVDDDRATDQRVLHIARAPPNAIHVFSGKVVSAVKAARIVAGMIVDPASAGAGAADAVL